MKKHDRVEEFITSTVEGGESFTSLPLFPGKRDSSTHGQKAMWAADALEKK
jgi:hypothetical protein